MLEPSTDLPIAMAIASSVCDKPVPHDMVFLGELGLAGELRSVRPIHACDESSISANLV